MQIISIEEFEGPLDLLLRLIIKNEIDIYDIPISEITTQYISYLSMLDIYNLDEASEFVAMAAQLLEIKTRMMLPKEESAQNSDEDPRAALAEKLADYMLIKHISEYLQGYEGQYLLSVTKDPSFFEDTPAKPEDYKVMPSALIGAFRKALTRSQAKIPKAIEAYALPTEYSIVEEKVDMIKAWLHSSKKASFFELIADATKDEAIAIFLAILELYKQNFLLMSQDGNFEEISIELREAT